MIQRPFVTSATVAPATANLFNWVDLRNPYGGQCPTLLEEIRIRDISSGSLSGSQGGICKIKLAIGGENGIPITNDFVPLWLLGPTGPGGTGLNTGGHVSHTSQTWRLPKPLYLPAGMSVHATLYHPESPTQGVPTSTYRITYTGKSLEGDSSRPQESAVPWVTAWQPTPVTSGVADTILQSPTSQLCNMTGKPLQVVSLGGRIVGIPGASSSYVNYNNFFVRIVDSDSNVIVRSSTPFYDVFPFETASWPINAVLKPKAFYRMFLEQRAAATTPTGNFTIAVALTGYRMERIR